MATQTITTTRWSCDTCEETYDNPEADETEIPSGWGELALSIPDVDEPITRDVCPSCLNVLLVALKLDR